MRGERDVYDQRINHSIHYFCACKLSYTLWAAFLCKPQVIDAKLNSKYPSKVEQAFSVDAILSIAEEMGIKFSIQKV